MATRKRKRAPVVSAEAAVRMSVFLPEATVRRLKAAAAARGMTTSQLIERLAEESSLTAEPRTLRRRLGVAGPDAWLGGAGARENR